MIAGIIDTWNSRAGRIVDVLLGSPESGVQRLFLLLLACLTLALVTRSATAATGVKDVGTGRRILALVMALGIMLIAAIASSLYLVPLVQGGLLRNIVLIGVPVIAGLVIGVPVLARFLRAKYMEALVGLVSGIVAAALAVILANAVVRAVKGSEKQSNKIRTRRRALEEVMGD